MSITNQNTHSLELTIANSENEYNVTRKDLPLHCPTKEMSKWNSHPRVFIPVEDTGEALYPYCGTIFRLSK